MTKRGPALLLLNDKGESHVRLQLAKYGTFLALSDAEGKSAELSVLGGQQALLMKDGNSKERVHLIVFKNTGPVLWLNNKKGSSRVALSAMTSGALSLWSEKGKGRVLLNTNDEKPLLELKDEKRVWSAP
jgi:hypothetical protein